MAPLEKRALISLIVGLVWTAILVVLFISRGGVEAFWNDDSTRILITFLYLGLLATALYAISWKARSGRTVDVDERDLAILRRSPQVQLMVVMVTLAAWVIGLSETYHEQGCVPSAWLYLMMMSTLVASTLAQSLGVLIGYLRS